MDKIRVVHSRPIWLKQTETWLYNQIKYLDDSIEPHVICQEVQNLDQFKVPNIHKLDLPSLVEKYHKKILDRLKHHTYSRPFLREIEKIRPSILHSNFGHFGWLEMPAAKKAKLRHVVTFYGHDLNRLPYVEPIWKERYIELFDHIDLVLCEGPFMAQSIANLGCPSNKIRVHHLGIPTDEIPFSPRKWSPSQTLRVLIAATFREKKGIVYALDALGKIQRMVPLEITIIGDADNEPRSQAEKDKILNAIRKNSLGERIRLLGFQPYTVLMKEAYNHHLFLSPSVTASDGDTEGGAPVILIEMAATGMPIVSSRHCDIPEVIHDGKMGFLAQERDIQGLTDRLEWLLNNYQEWTPLLQEAKRHIEQEYDANIQGRRLSKIYSGLSK